MSLESKRCSTFDKTKLKGIQPWEVSGTASCHWMGRQIFVGGARERQLLFLVWQEVGRRADSLLFHSHFSKF